MTIKGASAVAAKCLILVLPAGTALADQDVLKVFANASFKFDNNLFRLPDDVDPSQVPGWTGVKPGRSDNVLALNAGVQVDKPYGQQRLKLSASLGNYRYAIQHHLDFTAYDYRASWDWHLTPRLSGRLSAEQSQTLYSFVNNQDFQRNVLTRQSQNLDADWWFGSNWHALFGVGRQVYEGSVQVQQDRDYTALRWEVGLRYDRDKVGSASLKLRRSDADYSTRGVTALYDNRFEQREFELGMQYAITGRSSLEGRLAWLERSHPNIPLRDYSGWAGRLAWIWDLTGAVRLNTEYRRELESWQDANSNQVVSDRLSIGPSWAYTAKQRLDLQLEAQERRHEGALPGAALPLRKDSILALNLSATWVPIQAVSVSAAWRREERDSNINGFDYSDDSLTLAVQGLF